MLQPKTKAERGRLTFARCLCGQTFANTRVSEQVDDEPTAFALHKIIEAGAVFVMCLDERADELLLRRWKDQVLERLAAPFKG